MPIMLCYQVGLKNTHCKGAGICYNLLMVKKKEKKKHKISYFFHVPILPQREVHMANKQTIFES